uniref:RING-type E3 ubiquitin transferase n=1 Tax=Kalanchoe fedtschenkoi TaxID=63787 RepID=A0A7N1A4K8_KALFE
MEPPEDELEYVAIPGDDSEEDGGQQQSQTEDEEEDDEEEEEDVVVVGSDSTRVSQNEASSSGQASVEIDDGSPGRKRRRKKEGEALSLGDVDGAEGGLSKGREWNREEIDGLFCPICMEAWTNDGVHQVCCLPCGHLYGLSCIQRWIKDKKSAAKCPQCNKKCAVNGIRKLYASQIVALDEESKKRIQFLENKCLSLEKKGGDLATKEAEWKKMEIKLQQQLRQATQKANYLESLLDTKQDSRSKIVHPGMTRQEKVASGHDLQGGREYFHFTLQKDIQVQGGQMVDIDMSQLIAIVARKAHGIGGMNLLTKVSLLSPHDIENIMLSPDTKAVKDLHISSFDRRLALLASLGKKLSIFSLDCNYATLCYDLPNPPWSCSWDINNSHHVYAGLTNGMMLMFDTRQSAGPVESIRGLTCNPIHTLHSLPHSKGQTSGVSSVLAASSVGLSLANFGNADERPYLIPGSEDQGVCISLAYCPGSDEAVASFRPRIDSSSDIFVSQTPLSPSFGIGQPVSGSHVLYSSFGTGKYQKLGSAAANVNSIRLPRSLIMDFGSENRVFVSGDDLNHDLVLQSLPSFGFSQRLKYPKYPMRDIKYTHSSNKGLLGCLSEDTLQLFSCLIQT